MAGFIVGPRDLGDLSDRSHDDPTIRAESGRDEKPSDVLPAREQESVKTFTKCFFLSYSCLASKHISLPSALLQRGMLGNSTSSASYRTFGVLI